MASLPDLLVFLSIWALFIYIEVVKPRIKRRRSARRLENRRFSKAVNRAMSRIREIERRAK